jgi:predicted transcriptional regulator
MAQKTIHLDEDLHEKLKEINERDGVPIAEILRRAVREWLDKREKPAKDAD